MPMSNGAVKPGTWPDYVARETRRSVASAAGKTLIYPGIGFNVPGASDEADTIYEVVKAAYAAGANGVVASREIRRNDDAKSHGIRASRARGREDRMTQSRAGKFNGMQWSPHRSLTRASSGRSI